MKTDKELLELAAKAAGLNYCDGRVKYVRGDLFGNEPAVVDWNPLTDDGDAFRLAVKLNITFVFCVSASLQDLLVRAGIGLPRGVHELVINGDREAATRRAIVRAAAAIGESK